MPKNTSEYMKAYYHNNKSKFYKTCELCGTKTSNLPKHERTRKHMIKAGMVRPKSVEQAIELLKKHNFELVDPVTENHDSGHDETQTVE